MSRHVIFLLATVVPFILTCNNPDDPFTNQENALGTVEVSSRSGLQTDSLFYDSTGNPITIKATVFLPEYIDSGLLTLRYEDGSYDTIPTSLFEDEENADNRTADTTLIFLRGGRIIVKMKVFIQGGYSTSDSAVMFLYRKPVQLYSLSIDSIPLTPEFNDTSFTYTAIVANDRSHVTITPSVDNPYVRVVINGDTLTRDGQAKPCSLRVGSNTFTVTTIADDTTTTLTYTVVVTRLPGTVATLDSLVLSAGMLEPAFDSSKLSGYAAHVEYSDDSLTITIYPTHTGASVSIDSSTGRKGPAVFRIPLQVGSNPVSITVVAEDNVTEKEYQLTVIRDRSSDASLASLTLGAGTLTPPFNPDTLRYSVSLPFVDSIVKISAKRSDPDAKAAIDGDTLPQYIVLPTGPDSVAVTVTAPDGRTVTTYTLLFDRAKGGDAALKQLIPSAGELKPPFDPDISGYAFSVADSNNTITFSVLPRHDRASVKINGAQSDSAFPLLPMTETPFNIVVTAEDGSTKKTYLVTVTRKGSDSSSLAGIDASTGQIFPDFHKDSLNYELRIPADSGKVRIKPTPLHNRATMTVKGTTVTAGNWSQEITAAQGNGTSLDIVVTSETGKQQKTYHIGVNRAYALTVNNDGHGSTVPEGKVDAFVTVPLPIKAAPAAGYHFNGWTVVSGTATIASNADSATTALVGSSATIQARFSLNRYSLAVTSNGNGTVSGTDTVLHGIPDTITATPSGGYHFTVWRVISGSVRFGDSTEATTTTVLENGNTVVQGIFGINDYQLTVTSSGNGTVSGSGPVTHGVAKAVKATPDTGHHFVAWRVTGGSAAIVDTTAAASNVTLMNGDATVQAVFSINRYTLTYDGNGHTEGNPPVEEIQDYKATVVVAGKGDLMKTGYLFSGWNAENDGSGSDYAAGATFTMDARNDTLYAKWESYTHTVTFDGQGATTPPNPTSKTITSPATTVDALPAPPFKTGCTFSGWYVNA